MTAFLRIVQCGGGVTLQDGGRFGLQRFGVGPAGAMDADAMRIANALVGNPHDAAVIEMTLFGMVLEVDGAPVLLALAGAEADLVVDSAAVPPLTSVLVQPGQRVVVSAARSGVYSVLAVGGGLAVAPDMGSLSFHKRAGMGGLNGAALKAGDMLPLNGGEPGPELSLPQPTKAVGAYRVVLGPQDDYIAADGIETFLTTPYTITAEADRMGFRLEGAPIVHAKGFNIVSDGIVTGAIQVPGNGQPIVLMADRQTTGGYPKIASIISADLSRFAQERPGAQVRFTAVSRAEAIACARQHRAKLEDYLARLAPADRGGLSSERLLRLNLVGGVVDAASGEGA